jgi:phosphoribosyl-ATP pyrophosphohydrolase/phosphoribosyl-AMP cyclohydrolase
VLETLDSVIASRVADERAERSVAAAIETPQHAPPTAGDNMVSTESSHPKSPAESKGPPSYTRRLLADRNLRLKKLGEETAELVAACADGDAARATEEAADLLYHTLVAVRAAGGSLRDIQRALARRHTAR